MQHRHQFVGATTTKQVFQNLLMSQLIADKALLRPQAVELQ